MAAVTYGFAPNPIGFTCGTTNGAATLTLSVGSTVFGMLNYSLISAGSAITLSLNGTNAILVNTSGTAPVGTADCIPVMPGTTIVINGSANAYGSAVLTVYPK